MNCSIYYNGTLKDDYNQNDIFNIINKYSHNFDAEIEFTNDYIIIDFFQGHSESLIIHFVNKTINNFFKWKGDNLNEIYKIFDLFIQLKPLFKFLEIEDDEGLWNEYLNQKSNCKIKLRPLSSEEAFLLTRVNNNKFKPLDHIEQFLIIKSGFKPISLKEMNPPSHINYNNYSLLNDNLIRNGSKQSNSISCNKLYNHSILRIIIQDFIKIMNISNFHDFNPQSIVDLVNVLKFNGESGLVEDVINFDFRFHNMLLKIWISYSFKYKNVGIIRNLQNNIRGLLSSKEAALYSIESIFLNKHTGSVINSKEAEIRKFVKKYYKTGALGEVMVIDKPEKELEIFISIMDYLGLRYITY